MSWSRTVLNAILIASLGSLLASGTARAQTPGPGVEVIDGPVQCAPPYDCRALDLRIDARPGEAGMQGLEVRFILPPPEALPGPGGQVPILFTFPGTGYCSTRDPFSSPNPGESFWEKLEADEDSNLGTRVELAGEGIVQVMLAIRGHRSCYQAGDGMYGTGSWIGPTEFADYDELLSRLKAGDLHSDIPAADPNRVGLSGGSHGGITTLIYASKSTSPEPFALAVPDVGSPDVSDWIARSFDPSEGLEGATGMGLLAIPGVVSQLRAYPGSDLQDRIDEAVSGDFSQWPSYWEYRTAYDPDGSLDTFNANVRSLVMHVGGRDCIVPVNRALDFFDQLQRDYARGSDNLLFSTNPHSCKQVTPRFPTGDQLLGLDKGGGFFPTWSEELKNWQLKTLEPGRLKWAARRYLLGAGGPEAPGPMLVTPLVQGEESEHREPYRAVRTFEALETDRRRYHLRPDGTLGERSAPFLMPVIEHVPAGVCTTMSIVNPCGKTGWGGGAALTRMQELEAIRSETAFSSSPLTDDRVLAGAPVVSATVKVDQPAPGGAGIVAQLWYTPPDAPPGSPGWLVTHGMRYLRAIPPGGVLDVEVPLDPRVLELKQGGALRLVLTNLTTYVKGFPWHHPVTDPYEVTLQVDAGHPAVLRLPLASGFAGLSLADLSAFGAGGPEAGEGAKPSGGVRPRPLKVKALVKRRRSGRATVVVRVGGAGVLELSGKNLTRRHKRVLGAGRVKLLVTPKGALRRALKRTGRAKVKLELRFTPDGGAATVKRRWAILLGRR